MIQYDARRFVDDHTFNMVQGGRFQSPLLELPQAHLPGGAAKQKAFFRFFRGNPIPDVAVTIGGASAGLLLGGPVGAIMGAAVGSIVGHGAEELVSTGAQRAREWWLRRRSPLRVFGMDSSAFQIVTGWKRDETGKLIEKYGLPVAGTLKPTDLASLHELARRNGLPARSQYYGMDTRDDLVNAGLGRDKVSFSCINTLPVRELMGSDRFSVNISLPENDGDFPYHDPEQEKHYHSDVNLHPKYPLKLPDGELLAPVWNEIDYAVITLVDSPQLEQTSTTSYKNVFQDGRFLNITGCHSFGTLGATRALFSNRSIANDLMHCMETGTFAQAVVECPLQSLPNGNVKFSGPPRVVSLHADD